jgi:thioredoxin reductase
MAFTGRLAVVTVVLGAVDAVGLLFVTGRRSAVIPADEPPEAGVSSPAAAGRAPGFIRRQVRGAGRNSRRKLCWRRRNRMETEGRPPGTVGPNTSLARVKWSWLTFRDAASVIAAGVSYRRLGVPALEALAGAGVFYGAGTIEAQAVAGKPAFVVGGGNSAGQAALHLSKYAEQVTILIRSPSLAASMSDYLIRQIGAAANVDVRYRCEVAGGGGSGHLEQLLLRHRDSGQTELVPAAGLFILIGAQPFTGWLPETVRRDQWGYILTGPDTGQHWPLQRAPFPLETTTPGVFAAGDVRHGAIKRVASAVGEGSTAIRLIHDYLALAPPAREGHKPRLQSRERGRAPHSDRMS